MFITNSSYSNRDLHRSTVPKLPVRFTAVAAGTVSYTRALNTGEVAKDLLKATYWDSQTTHLLHPQFEKFLLDGDEYTVK